MQIINLAALLTNCEYGSKKLIAVNLFSISQPVWPANKQSLSLLCNDKMFAKLARSSQNVWAAMQIVCSAER